MPAARRSDPETMRPLDGDHSEFRPQTESCRQREDVDGGGWLSGKGYDGFIDILTVEAMGSQTYLEAVVVKGQSKQ
jgi:hypothetical protein